MHGFGPWDIRITIDLFLGGLGIGIFLMSVFLYFFNKDHYYPVVKISSYLSPVLVGLGLLFLISELGRPERFITTIYRFNPQSVTSWGGLIQGFFMIISFGYAVMLYKNLSANKLFRILQISGTIFALGVGIYHGLLLSSLGRPLWSGGLMSLLFLVSSLLGGTVILLILKSISFSFLVPMQVKSEALASEDDEKKVNFTLLLFLLTSFQTALLLIWHVSVYRSSLETIDTMNVLMSNYGLYWWNLVVIVGLLLPLIGTIYQLVKDYKKEMSNRLAIALSLMVLIGSFSFKFIILTVGQYTVQFFL